MNVNNLKENMVIKNYKELCELLGEKPKAGKGKVYQLKEFERYFNYTKEGHKFIIQEIYKEPLAKIDNRSEGNNSIYSDNIQKLIIHYLSTKDKEDRVELSCSKLLNVLDMVNDNYRDGRSNIDKLSDIIKIEKSFIYDFYNNTQSSLKSKVETALNKLTRKSLITWKKVFIIAREEITIVLNEAGTPLIQDNQVVYNKINKFERATDEDERHIINIERNVMINMGYDDKKDVFLKGEYNEFRKKVENELRRKYNIQFYYYAYEILYNIDHIKAVAIDDIASLVVRLSLNDDIMEGINNSCTNRHSKALEKYKNLDKDYTSNEYCKMILSDKYIHSNEVLANKLIKYGSKRLSIK